MPLRILPGNVANLIAAGEVVQRPASVVKELMENAVDAGATKLNVVIKDAGRTLIQVIDDGCGMTPDDAVLCFERHATSKIATADDLDAIGTFGFRGEALASIAAVSEVTLRTRRKEDEVGCEVEFAASEHLATREVAAPSGSNFAVRNLFYNVPARRKFLKSDAVEWKHIVEEFTRVALTRPDIAFNLTHDGREVFVLQPAQSLKFRILDVLGTGVTGELVDVSAETSVVTVSGFAGRPESARKTLGNQYLFVNGRYFRSPYLHKAVMKAYEELIPDGTTPSYFLYLSVDPHSIDVNIHPTKTEIKFEEDSVIYQVLYACVRESVGRFTALGDIDFESGGSSLPLPGRRFEEYNPVSAPSTQFDPAFNPFDSLGEDYTPAKPEGENAPAGPYSRYIDRRDDYGRLFEEKTLPSAQVLIVQGRYILSQSNTGVLMIHIRRARERVLYDRFLAALSKNAPAAQTMLFPEQVQVGVEARALLDGHAAQLRALGFDIVPFGTDTVAVNAVPEGFPAETGRMDALLSDILLILSEERNALPEMLQASLAGKFAILGAAGPEKALSTVEAQRLMDTLLTSSNPEYTAGGKKIIAVLPLDELERKF